jgi:AraC-like DNA-binding protein
MGGASLANVARALGRHPRTLQRELSAAGRDFRDLLADARDSLATTLLRDRSLTIDDVATRLGYASSTAFIRAYRARHGVTPGQVRG